MIIAPSIKPDWKIPGSDEGKMVSLQGMCMLRTYLLVQKNLGLTITETGTALIFRTRHSGRDPSLGM
jgi:hypothetical protein